MTNKTSFLAELKRRHVFRVAIAYAVTAWLLLQLGAIVFPVVHAPRWCEGVLLAFLVLGFPLALFLAWAFEVTPEGVRRTLANVSESPRRESRRRRSAQILNALIIVILTAAVGVLLWQRVGSGGKFRGSAVAKNTAAAPATVVPARSIAVLPFENLSADKNNAYFADGMQDLILSKLAEIGGLTVISRTSTLRYQSHPEDIKAIGRQLGVATLLEGSVQKAGNQVLINVQLINARTDHHLWAQSYQRTLKNVFGVEGEVATKVAAALKAKLDPAEKARLQSAPTHNSAAYDAYLHGLSLSIRTSAFGQNMLRIATAYQQAVKLDPSFAEAWARLASIDSEIHFSLLDYTPTRLAQARAALKRARALAPNALATRIAEGDYAYYALYDFPEALASYRKVLTLSPSNAAALANIGYVNRREGHWQRAIDYLEQSLTLDPRDVNTLNNLAWSYACLHRFEKARKIFRQALAINPGDPDVTGFLAWVYQAQGRVAQSGKTLAGARIPASDWSSFPVLINQAFLTRQYKKAIRLLKDTLVTGKHLSNTARGIYYQFLGQAERFADNPKASRDAFIKALKVLSAAPDSPIVLADQAVAHAGLDHKTAAFAALRQALATTPARHDVFQRPRLRVTLAEIQTMLGQYTQATATLRKLLTASPGAVDSMMITPALLRLDPRWAPLRNSRAFQALLKHSAVSPAGTTTTVPPVP